MGADPEPLDDIIFDHAQAAPTWSDTDGIDVGIFMDLFEVEAGVGGVGFPEAVVFPGLSLYANGEATETGAKLVIEDGFHSSSIPMS